MTRTRAWPYLLPGILSALVFVIFPMLYTMGMGFTNYSARNLLDYERARALLLEEKLTVEGSERAFSLHPEGGQLRLHLQGEGSGAALVSPLLKLDYLASAGVQPIRLTPNTGPLAAALPVRDVVPHLPALRTLELTDDASKVAVDLKPVAMAPIEGTHVYDGVVLAAKRLTAEGANNDIVLFHASSNSGEGADIALVRRALRETHTAEGSHPYESDAQPQRFDTADRLIPAGRPRRVGDRSGAAGYRERWLDQRVRFADRHVEHRRTRHLGGRRPGLGGVDDRDQGQRLGPGSARGVHGGRVTSAAASRR